MWGLLKESWDELAKNWLAFVQCFWLPGIFCFWIALYLPASFAQDLALRIAFATIGVIAISSGAVRWHRHVIQGEKVSWIPWLPNALALVYASKLVLMAIVTAVLAKIVTSLIGDIVMPIVFRFALVFILPRPSVFRVVLLAIPALAFVLAFGPWMLRLPEGSLETAYRGARKQWPQGGKRHYLQALALVSLGSLAVSELQLYLGDGNSIVLECILLLASIVFSAIGLSLLTVAYRRNMKSS